MRAEPMRIPLAGNRKTFDRDTVDGVAARGTLVPPRDVVARARRQHADLGMFRKMLGNVARVQLGAPADIGAIPLHNDGKPHFGSSGLASGDGAGTGTLGAISSRASGSMVVS